MQDGFALSPRSTGFQKFSEIFLKLGGYLDHYQNLITCSFWNPEPFHKFSLQSVHNFLSNIGKKQTNQHYWKHNLLCQEVNISKLCRISYVQDHKWQKYSIFSARLPVILVLPYPGCSYIPGWNLTDTYFFLFKYDLVRSTMKLVKPKRGLNPWPPDHDNTFHLS